MRWIGKDDFMKRLITALLTASLVAGSVTIAEARDGDRHRRGDRDRHEHSDRDWRDGDRNWDRGDRRRDRRHFRRWARGDRFYWDRRHDHYVPYYYVDNWSSYRLRRPPRGYRWVRAHDDFLLVALTTGIILEILANNDRYDDRYYDRYDDDYYYR
jgi:Ni/Co efflux regulator RcnB